MDVLCKHEGDLQLRPDGSPMVGTAGMCSTASNEVPLTRLKLCLLSRRVVPYMNIPKYAVYLICARAFACLTVIKAKREHSIANPPTHLFFDFIKYLDVAPFG